MNKIKVYLAGSCSTEQRTIMQRIAKHLRENSNIDLYCPFELKIPNAWDMSQENWARAVFEKDIEAIDNCDIFLMVTPGRNSTAGTNFEQGYAYAKGKKICVLQYTNDNTSIMTFSGCDEFVNSNLNDITMDALCQISNAYNNLYRAHWEVDCKTILT